MRNYINCSDVQMEKYLTDLFVEMCNIPAYKGKKKVYFAGPWFTNRAKMCYDYCTNVKKALGKRCKYDVFWPRYMKKCSPQQAFRKDIEELDKADIVIAFISDKDVGTAFEIGYAKAKNIPVVLLVFDETDFESKTNLMLAYAGKAIPISKFDKFLLNELTPDDYIDTDFKWEAIE